MFLGALLVLVLFVPGHVRAGGLASESCTPLHLPANDTTRFRCRIVHSCDPSLRPTTYLRSQVPGRAFDLRFQVLTVVNPMSSPHSDNYQILLNATWEPSHREEQKLTRGFDLRIVDKESGKRDCFLLFLPELDHWGWLERHRVAPPRFRWASVDFFRWGSQYLFEVQPLPLLLAPNPPDNVLRRTYDTPNHPAHVEAARSAGWLSPKEPPPDGPVDCATFVNGAAHKWVAAFKSINIKPWSKELFTEFYAAPPHYCFQAYEIRLHPHLSAEVKESQIIPASSLYSEHLGNVTVKLGNFTFTNVSVGAYDVGLIPMERSKETLRDGTRRCLCPTGEISDPSHHAKVVCSCTEAKWNNVQMYNPTTPPVPPPPCHVEPEQTRCVGGGGSGGGGGGLGADASSPGLLLFAGMVFVGLVALVLGLCILAIFWRYYRSKAARLRFPLKEGGGGGGKERMAEECCGAETVPIPPHLAAQVPPVRLLLIYSHDSPEHERAVAALAEFLQSQASCEVELDVWAMRELVRNKTDWLYASLARANKVLFINSAGAAYRWHHRLAQPHSRLRRRRESDMDSLFLPHLDAATQASLHHSSSSSSVYSKFLSAYFSYTPPHFLLQNLAPLVRFQIPNHVEALVDSLHGSPQKLPPLRESSEGQKLMDAVSEASAAILEDPDWFSRLHYKELIQPSAGPLSSCPEDEVGSNASGSNDSGLSSLSSSACPCPPPLMGPVSTSPLSPETELTELREGLGLIGGEECRGRANSPPLILPPLSLSSLAPGTAEEEDVCGYGTRDSGFHDPFRSSSHSSSSKALLIPSSSPSSMPHSPSLSSHSNKHPAQEPLIAHDSGVIA